MHIYVPAFLLPCPLFLHILFLNNNNNTVCNSESLFESWLLNRVYLLLFLVISFCYYYHTYNLFLYTHFRGSDHSFLFFQKGELLALKGCIHSVTSVPKLNRCLEAYIKSSRPSDFLSCFICLKKKKTKSSWA